MKGSLLICLALVIGLVHSRTYGTRTMSIDPLQNFQINPFLDCVDIDNTTNTVTAYFGYESLEDDIIQLLVGSSNRFIPNPPDQGQPILFFPGLHERAFRMNFPSGQILQWSLLGVNVPVSASSKSCTNCACTNCNCPPFNTANCAVISSSASQALCNDPKDPMCHTSATVTCPAQKTMLNGGASCSLYMGGSYPTPNVPNSWTAVCVGTAVAYATCC